MGSDNWWMVPAAVGAAVVAPYMFPAMATLGAATGAGAAAGGAGLGGALASAAPAALSPAAMGMATGSGLAGAGSLGAIGGGLTSMSPALAGMALPVAGGAGAGLGALMEDPTMAAQLLGGGQQPQQPQMPMPMMPPPQMGMSEGGSPSFAQAVGQGAVPGYMPQPTAQMLGGGYGSV